MKQNGRRKTKCAEVERGKVRKREKVKAKVFWVRKEGTN